MVGIGFEIENNVVNVVDVENVYKEQSAEDHIPPEI
jgi:hypothetical protein